MSEHICKGCNRDTARGAWLAYYADRSGAYVFDSEIEALRAAVNSSMMVRFVAWGEALWEE